VAAGSGRRFPLPFGRGLSPGNHTRFPASPHRTVREVFPHTALLQELRVVYPRCHTPSPLASSEDSEIHSPRFLALAMRLSQSSSETPAAGAASLLRSYAVSRIISTMAPSDSLPSSPGLRSQPYTRSLLPRFFSRGLEGPPQLTRPLSRHVAPDTPEESRAVRLSYIPRYRLPRSDTGSPSSVRSLRGYIWVHSRYNLPVRVASF